MTVWFTSDNHFGHHNIIEHCNRPFRDAQHMDKEMISRWNGVVRKGDSVYHLGDLSFLRPRETSSILSRLNGQIHFIKGNHDKLLPEVRDMFTSVSDLKEIKIEGQKIILCHYPMLSWNQMHRGSWMLHGHSHGTLRTSCKSCSFEPGRKMLDVGVDCHDYTPISFSRVKKYMEDVRRSIFHSVDHHRSILRKS